MGTIGVLQLMEANPNVHKTVFIELQPINKQPLSISTQFRFGDIPLDSVAHVSIAHPCIELN